MRPLADPEKQTHKVPSNRSRATRIYAVCDRSSQSTRSPQPYAIHTMKPSSTLPRRVFRGLTTGKVVAAAVAAVSLSANASVCPANVGARETPTADFTANANGTVKHTRTGLMWKQCNEGLSGAVCATGSASFLAWTDALTAAKGSNFAGYSDWRLPNKQELESLVDRSCYSPAMNDGVFPGAVADWTWTSTTNESDPAAASMVSFDAGHHNANAKAFPLAVRFVRGGQFFDSLASTDAVAPETTIISSPVSSAATVASIAFAGTDNVAVTGFECSLDGAPFASCASTVNLSGLALGSHTFQVRAVDAAGNVDATPASVTWTVQALPVAATAPIPALNIWLQVLLVLLLAAVGALVERRHSGIPKR